MTFNNIFQFYSQLYLKTPRLKKKLSLNKFNQNYNLIQKDYRLIIKFDLILNFLLFLRKN